MWRIGSTVPVACGMDFCDYMMLYELQMACMSEVRIAYP